MKRIPIKFHAHYWFTLSIRRDTGDISKLSLPAECKRAAIARTMHTELCARNSILAVRKGARAV